MAVPIGLVGAWRRTGLLLNGVRQVDYCDVLWLQTPEWFADIRLVIDERAEIPVARIPNWCYKNWSFAGIATWENPINTWDHLIDSGPEPFDDVSPLTWTDGVVLETGKSSIDGGQEIDFTEEWLRMTDDDATWDYKAGINRARIEVGRFAIEISDNRPEGIFLSTRYERTGSEWVPKGEIRVQD